MAPEGFHKINCTNMSSQSSGLDNHQPEANRSRSETYFIVWQDTSTAQLSVSAGLAINPIPEYFRRQRQIIN